MPRKTKTTDVSVEMTPQMEHTPSQPIDIPKVKQKRAPTGFAKFYQEQSKILEGSAPEKMKQASVLWKQRDL